LQRSSFSGGRREGGTGHHGTVSYRNDYAGNPDETEDGAMRLSDHTSMIVTAFCFMILMLVITAPAAPGS
jgi:hypothetical protein